MEAPNIEWNVFACRIAEREAAKQIEILPSPQNAEKNEREWVRSCQSLSQGLEKVETTTRNLSVAHEIKP